MKALAEPDGATICVALASALATRGRQADYVILSELIFKEPLGPFVRGGGDMWLAVVRGSLFAMHEQLKSSDALDQRFLGVKAGNDKALQLDEKWAYNTIKQVGTYGESYERNGRHG